MTTTELTSLLVKRLTEPTLPVSTNGTDRSIQIGKTNYPLVLPRLNDSRLHLAGVVIILHTLGQVSLGFHVSVPQILIAIITCFVLQVLITFREQRAFVWPASAMLTGSGIALILRVPSTPVGAYWSFHQWWIFSGVAAFSLMTKFIVRRQGSHLFNPSNVGLVIAFIVLGSRRVEPLDFWWAPISNPAMIIAYAVILVGGTLITRRLGLLVTVVSFWITLCIGTAVNAASGQCFTSRWAFAPVCGTELWLTIATSPEILIFTFFMITDPRTVPRGRVARITFGALVGIVCVMLMAPQQTEFGAKVALLAGLTIVTAIRPPLERVLPAPGSEVDSLRSFGRLILQGTNNSAKPFTVLRRGATITLVGSLVFSALAIGGRSAQGLLASEPENLIGRLATQIDPRTFPNVVVDQEVIDWNHEIDVTGAKAIVLTLAENLALESQALVDKDTKLLEAINHGDRLEEMQARLHTAEISGQTIVSTYKIDTIVVTLLLPFGRQDGLSLGLIATGTLTTETRTDSGVIVSRTSTQFKTMWAMRRATGSRWLTIAELPVPNT